jgi:hypothetical protein
MRQHKRNQWEKRANALIESLGAEPVDEWYPWRLKTKVGMLSLLVRANELRNHGPGTVFTRFDSPPDAKEVVDCNPHSGKWNHHYFDAWTGPNALADLEQLLRSIM